MGKKQKQEKFQGVGESSFAFPPRLTFIRKQKLDCKDSDSDLR